MRKVLYTLIGVAVFMLATCDVYISGKRVWYSPAGQFAEYLKELRLGGSK